MSKTGYELPVNSVDKFIAKQVNDSEMEIWLAEIKIRARRRVGEISKELDKSKGGKNPNATLPIAGLVKKSARKRRTHNISRQSLRKIADIPEEKFGLRLQTNLKTTVFYTDS